MTTIMMVMCLLLLLSVPLGSIETTARSDPVLVVGGGLSGLSAVLELEKRGYSTILVEASHRLGGRVSSYSSDIELGGTYLHGSTSRLANLIVKEYQLPTVVSGGASQHPGKESAVWTTEDGQMLDKEETERRGSLLYQQWLGGVQRELKNFTHVDEEATIAHLEATSRSVIRNITCNNTNTTDDDDCLDRAMLNFEIQMSFQHDVGVPFSRVALEGLYNNWDWIELDGPDRVLQNGLESLIHAMRRNIKGEIILDSPVMRISHWNQTCALTLQDKKGKSISSVLMSRACIVTLPLGVLKANHATLFDPPLPREKQQALERASVAAFNTLIVTWNKPICRAGAYYLLTKNENTSSFAAESNPLSNGFVCPQVLRGNATVSHTTQFYLYGDEHPFDDTSYWKRKAVQVVAQVMSEDLSQQNIVDLTISKWHQDPFILGSYSAPSTSTRGNADRAILQESLGSTVFFAGEHTNTCGRYQSLDGAYDTGIFAARQVAGTVQHGKDAKNDESPMTCPNVME